MNHPAAVRPGWSLLALLALAWLCPVIPLQARDSLHLVCVGRVNLGAANFKDPVKFALTYDDQRGGVAGDKRQVWVAMSLSAGNRIGVGEDLMDGTTAQVAKVTLRNDEDKSDVLFRGTVGLVDEDRAIVNGDFTTSDKQVHHLHVTLECYEVPGIFFGQNLKQGR